MPDPVLCDGYLLAREVPGVIDLERFTPANNSGVKMTPLGLELETPRDRWAYAAVFELGAERAGMDRAANALVSLDVSVERGSVGIGCTGQDPLELIQERFLASADGRAWVRIFLTPASHARQLFVRQSAQDGVPSRVVIHGIKVHEARRPPLLTTKHHEIFKEFHLGREHHEGEFFVNIVGAKQRVHFRRTAPVSAVPLHEAPMDFDGFDPGDEYFEWIDVLESVAAARGEFNMIELGAGFGRWTATAIAALRRRRDGARLDYRAVCVEPEPSHFDWLGIHLRDNDIDLSRVRLINAAVCERPGSVFFHAGNSSAWYGQAIVSPEYVDALRSDPALAARTRTSIEAPTFWERIKDFVSGNKLRRRIVEVSAITLADALEGLEHVDLLDMDIQGAEFDALKGNMDRLNALVKRVHIGTHSHEIEQNLRDLFTRGGWRSHYDFRCQRPSETPYGTVTFGDGVQSWINASWS
ncbi:FkbM family methyltransferase [bacterium]|nr:FkbM family methyltransferase [bacterium]